MQIAKRDDRITTLESEVHVLMQKLYDANHRVVSVVRRGGGTDKPSSATFAPPQDGDATDRLRRALRSANARIKTLERVNAATTAAVASRRRRGRSANDDDSDDDANDDDDDRNAYTARQGSRSPRSSAPASAPAPAPAPAPVSRSRSPAFRPPSYYDSNSPNGRPTSSSPGRVQLWRSQPPSYTAPPALDSGVYKPVYVGNAVLRFQPALSGDGVDHSRSPARGGQPRATSSSPGRTTVCRHGVATVSATPTPAPPPVTLAQARQQQQVQQQVQLGFQQQQQRVSASYPPQFSQRSSSRLRSGRLDPALPGL